MVNKRLNKILELLMAEKKIDVVKLAELLQVSQVTIRKDLNKLESSGLIRREHGYAIIKNVDDVMGRMAYHYDIKLQIAKAALNLIKDGDTIMIESGSCCAIFAKELAQHRQNLTVITNSVFIANSLGKANNSFQIILLGGIYQPNSQCMVGPMVRNNASNFDVEYLFIGTDGYNQRTGFSNKDQMRVQAVRDMANYAEKIIILTESEKFQQRGTIPLNIPHQPKLLITDQNISQEDIKDLVIKNIQVIKA